jgi:RHS repeat-associated protein
LKADHNLTIAYIHGLSDFPLMEKVDYGGGELTKLYVYGPTGLIAVNDNGGWFFLLKDHLGSTRVVLNENNNVVSSYDYMPYGGIMRSRVNTDIAYQFTGQEYDTELGLHNFRARLYDSDLAMFYAMDPAGQGFSPFAFSLNNPVVYVDRDGKVAWFVPIIIGAVMNTAMNADKIVHLDDFFKFAGIGALGGAMSMMGNPGAWHGLQNVLLGAVQGGLTSGLNAEARGGKFIDGFKTGAVWGGAFGLATSEQFGNAFKGQDWSSNQQVLDNFVGAGNHQGALDYFEFDGEYVNSGADNKVGKFFGKNKDIRAFTDPNSGKIYFSERSFSSMSQLHSDYMHEMVHVRMGSV